RRRPARVQALRALRLPPARARRVSPASTIAAREGGAPRAATLPGKRPADHRRGDLGAHRRRRHRSGSPDRRGPARQASFVTGASARPRPVMLGVILAARTIANVGPLGIPAIASLIRIDLGLTLTQAGSFLSAYGPI